MWLRGKARSNIRHFLKSQQHNESVSLGRRLVEQALHEIGGNYGKLPPETLQVLLHDLDYKNEEELLYAVGVGNHMAMVIAKRLIYSEEKKDPQIMQDEKPLVIKGTEGMVINFAECCQPIPGDSITGRFQQGRGITVHTSDCIQIANPRLKPQQLISLRWDEGVEGEYWVDITAEVSNQRGVLAALATAIANADSNIGNINVDPRDGKHNAVTFSISVKDRTHLAKVMRRLKAIKMVLRLYRKKQGD